VNSAPDCLQFNRHVPNIQPAVISVHGHNDLRPGCGQLLEAVNNGARQLECTIKRHRRTGRQNASLEETGDGPACAAQYFNPFLQAPAQSIAPLTRIPHEESTKNLAAGLNLTRDDAFSPTNGSSVPMPSAQ